MSLSVKSVKGTVHIKWTGEMATGEMTAEWKISPSMNQEEMLGVLVNATNFLTSQMHTISRDIKSLEAGLTASGVPPAGVSTSDLNVARVPMMPPASLSEAPAGGAPTNQEFWSGMPTTVPQELTASPMGWEMIPPGED